MCFLHNAPSKFEFGKVLPDHYYKGWQPGETITEAILEAWSEWEASFFYLEKALLARAKAKATPKGKRKPRRKDKVPVSVKQVRGSAFQHIKALDKILWSTLGFGLAFFRVVTEGYSNPLLDFTAPFDPDFGFTFG